MIIEKINNKYMLLKMKKDIEKTKWNLEHFDEYKKRINRIKNLKIYGNVARIFAPYVLTFGIVTFGFHCVTGNYPFSRDYIKSYPVGTIKYVFKYLNIILNQIN